MNPFRIALSQDTYAQPLQKHVFVFQVSLGTVSCHCQELFISLRFCTPGESSWKWDQEKDATFCLAFGFAKKNGSSFQYIPFVPIERYRTLYHLKNVQRFPSTLLPC